MMVTACLFRYEANLKPTRAIGIQKGLVSGLGQGMVWTIAFGIIALAFWYGGVLVREDGYSPGFVLQVYNLYIHVQCASKLRNILGEIFLRGVSGGVGKRYFYDA